MGLKLSSLTGNFDYNKAETGSKIGSKTSSKTGSKTGF